MNRSAIVLLAALFLPGCATEYQARAADGGYTQTQLGPQTWQVVFEGNRYTDTAQMHDFALLRGAELTLQQGYSHFTYAADASAPVSAQSLAQSLEFQRESKTLQLYHGQPGAGVAAFDARAVCDTMQLKYSIACR